MSGRHRSGPVRSDAARQSVLEATAALFSEQGYDHLTIEGIAARAGVGKQTVYRWWRSKGEIISECLLEGLMLPDTFIPPNTGDLRADLQTWLRGVFALLEEPRGEALLRSLVAAAAEHAEVGRRLGEAVIGTNEFSDRLNVGSSAPGTSNTLHLSEALVSIVLFRAITRRPLDAAEAESVIDSLVARTGG